MELRLLIAFILMGVVLFVTPYFYKSVNPPAKKSVPAAAKTGTTAPPVSSTTGAAAAPKEVAEAAAPPPAGATPPVAGQTEETRIIDTDLFHITFSNKGGVVKSWQLKKHKAHSGTPQELVNTAAKVDPPGALYFPGQKPSVDLNQALYKIESDGLSIRFEYSNGAVVAHKSFQFNKSSYLLDVATEVIDSGKPVPHAIEWRGGFGDLLVANPAAAEQTLRFDLTDSKLVKTGAKTAKDNPVTVTGNYSFAGIEDQYFVAVCLPEHASPLAVTTTLPSPSSI